MNTVGENIKRIRKEKGITQEAMSKLLGISRSYLANLEAGRKNIGEATIKKMSENSGISTYYLTTGEKTTNDMTSDEIDKLVNDEVKVIRNEMGKKLDEQLNEKLNELLNSHLSAIEVFFLLNSINYLYDSNTEDLEFMSSILRILIYNNNILNERVIFPEDTEQISEEKVLQNINQTTQEFNKFLKHRYGYEGD